MSSVVPMTQSEARQSTTKFGMCSLSGIRQSLQSSTGINGVTVFEWKLRTTGTSVLQALLAYFNVATKGAGTSS
jgi:hypothetical protein